LFSSLTKWRKFKILDNNPKRAKLTFSFDLRFPSVPFNLATTCRLEMNRFRFPSPIQQFHFKIQSKSDKPGLRSRSRSRSPKESEVFGWCRSRIPNNTGSRMFCPTPDVQLDHFLHHTPKLGIPIEMVQLLSKLLLKQRFLAVHHGFHWFYQPNFIPFMLRSWSLKFWNGRSWSRIFYLRLHNPAINWQFKSKSCLNPKSYQSCSAKSKIASAQCLPHEAI